MGPIEEFEKWKVVEGKTGYVVLSVEIGKNIVDYGGMRGRVNVGGMKSGVGVCTEGWKRMMCVVFLLLFPVSKMWMGQVVKNVLWEIESVSRSMLEQFMGKWGLKTGCTVQYCRVVFL